MKPESGATACYVAGMWAGLTLGAIAGTILALDGATWHRVWQLAACGAYLGMGVIAFFMALAREGQDDDDDSRGRDVVAGRDGTGSARG